MINTGMHLSVRLEADPNKLEKGEAADDEIYYPLYSIGSI